MARKQETKLRTLVIGLDLSLTCSGAIILAPEWEPGDWTKHARWMTAGRKLTKDATPKEQAQRVFDITREVIDFVRVAHDDLFRRESSACMEVFIEEYAFASSQSRAHAIGELGGVMKDRMLRAFRFVPTPLTASTARKLLLGVGRCEDIKRVVLDALVGAGAPWAKLPDVADAFVIANAGRAELGLPALTLV